MKENLEKLKKDLFNFRFQKVNGQVKSPAKITETKKFNPQIPTIIFACVRFLVFAILGKYSINNRTLWARSSVGRAPPF